MSLSRTGMHAVAQVAELVQQRAVLREGQQERKQQYEGDATHQAKGQQDSRRKSSWALYKSLERVARVRARSVRRITSRLMLVDATGSAAAVIGLARDAQYHPSPRTPPHGPHV